MACDELAGLALDGATITRAARRPAAPFVPPGESFAMMLPPFCRVEGLVAPAIRFEVWLPEAGWNGKFQGVGNVGMAGNISYDRLAEALYRGYATASTDTGHRTSGPFDATWAIGRPDLVEDFGHRAIHLTAVHGQAITAARYGRPSAQDYFAGCSSGGHQALMDVQRYPDDYDGVIAGAPTHQWTRLYAARLWYSRATLADPERYLPPTKIGLLDDAVTAACDADDGLRDGVLADPRTCDFDPGVLVCAAGQDDERCLTPAQVQAVRDIWQGPRTSTGEAVFPGLLPGGEAEAAAWDRWITGGGPFTSFHWQAADNFYRHMVFEDPDWDFRSFDFDTDVARARERVGAALDADDPDLGAFRRAGGKLIVFHGWSDADVPPLSSVEYYEDVIATTGAGRSRASAIDETQDFFRLFMVPGMGHCRGGRGTDEFDMLTALEDWVERGVPPDRIEAARRRDGRIDRTRPLCPYPQTAAWDGVGDPADAASFRCVDE